MRALFIAVEVQNSALNSLGQEEKELLDGVKAQMIGEGITF